MSMRKRERRETQNGTGKKGTTTNHGPIRYDIINKPVTNDFETPILQMKNEPEQPNLSSDFLLLSFAAFNFAEFKNRKENI
jgi:hypothetical protein